MNDNLWINLKVLEQLPAFAKLNTFHELFYIEKSTFYNPIGFWRMLRGDNRSLTIKRIDKLLEQSSLILTSNPDNCIRIKFTKPFKEIDSGDTKFEKNL